jgi:hypothetical protein
MYSNKAISARLGVCQVLSQIALHAIANGPANHTTRIQIQDDGQIQPPFAGPYVGDVAGPFLNGRNSFF